MRNKNNSAYPNLKAEMSRKGILIKDIASSLCKTDDWVDGKLRGKTALSVVDAIKIKNTYFKEIPFEYLFSDTAIIPIHIKE